MQQALKCKVNILVWGHESRGENLWDFIITSVERKLTIIGSLRSDLIHWAESQAKPRGAAGSGVSEFLVQITDYYSELNHAARSSRLELELFSDLNILCGRVKIRNIQKLHPHSGKTRARYKWTHISEYCVCRVNTLDCWADWTWRDPLSQPYHILLQAENLMRKIMMIIANYFVTIGFMG